MSDPTDVTTETGDPVKGKVEFGFQSLSKPTPQAAKNFYTFYLGMNTSILAWLGYTHMIPAANLYEILGVFKFLLDPMAYLLMKMWGIVPDNANPVNTRE